jgi:hypothetical protein
MVAIFFCENTDKPHKAQQVSSMKDSSFFLAVIDAESTGFMVLKIEPSEQEQIEM